MVLVEFVSATLRLDPGGIIANRTRNDVGNARKPERYLEGREIVIAKINGIGRLGNLVVKDGAR